MTEEAKRLALVEALKAAAICHTDHPASAVTALLRAATEILCLTFETPQVAAMIMQGVEEALTLSAPAGRA